MGRQGSVPSLGMSGSWARWELEDGEVSENFLAMISAGWLDADGA